MNQSNTNQEVDNTVTKNVDFGSALAKARRASNHTIDEVCEQLKISARTINAIEASDAEALPAPTFTQGYIRAYAKFLQFPEESVIEAYNRAVPHEQSTSLKPRSNLPGEASSKSPLMLAVTIFLIIAGIAALAYGSFEYYQEKADVMEVARESKERKFTGNSLDAPGTNRLVIKQNARLTDDDELIVEQSEPPMETALEQEIDVEPVVASANDVTVREVNVRKANSRIEAAINETVDTTKDVLEIFAENGAWLEVRDANNERLIYSSVPAGSRKILIGQAPFRITIGNANSNRLLINDLVIDMSEYISENNIATFSVSSEDQRVIFH